MIGQRHMVECHCVLPLYKNKKPIMYHRFAVYSKLDKKNGKVIPKFSNCNNCGVTHEVFELCRSTIVFGKEDINTVRTIKDISVSLPENILNILNEYNCTVDVYEEVEDILENKIFPSEVILRREIVNENHLVKILQVKNDKNIKIASELIVTTYGALL